MFQVSNDIKNKLLYPLRVAAHNCLGIPAPWHMAGLPSEIIVKICSYLSLKCVLNLSETCHRLFTIANDPSIWYCLYNRDMKKNEEKSSIVNWKAKYREEYARKKVEAKNKDEKDLFDPNLTGIFPEYPRIPSIPNPNPLHPFGPLGPIRDPDSPYFQGEIPAPRHPHPLNPLGPNMPNPINDPFPLGGPMYPEISDPFGNNRGPPFLPSFRGRGGGGMRGPRFDFF